MIKKFPLPLRPPAPPLATLALHSEESREEHEAALAWVSWIFQTVRARCDALVFQTDAVERGEVLRDWEGFAQDEFLARVAPVMLRGWQAALVGAEEAMVVCDRALGRELSASAARRSIAGGKALLDHTHGAKHQAALGRFRERWHRGDCDGHLAIVWAAVAVLFQLPPLDVLAEYLREEWVVGTKACPHHEPPCGPVSFDGLAHRALHDAKMMSFAP